MKNALVVILLAVAGCSHPAPTASQSQAVSQSSPGLPPKFTVFESDPVRPLVRSSDGQHIYACNIPAGTLEVLLITRNGLTKLAYVNVGSEPVAVALHGNQAWVVNEASDTVSVVDITYPAFPRVVQTLHVGDEPRDIVFAGPNRRYAYVTTAHRGQNNPNDPQLLTPSVPRADVWVIDTLNPTATDVVLGGTPVIVSLFTDTPRALAVSPDGTRVYAAGFKTGNRTTSINELLVPDGGQVNGGLPAPNTDASGELQPETGLIAQFNGQHWLDSIGRIWDSAVNFSLPDKDVFVLDATVNPPVQLAGSAGYWTGVGTVLFNMVVNPVSGKVYVSNQEALNLTRFAGNGGFQGSTTVQGHMHESRITVLAAGHSAVPHHLNPHINYSHCCADLPNTEASKSLAIPMQMEVTGDGKTLYLAAFGSSKVGIYDTAKLEAGTFVPSTANQVTVTGGGPAGLALDESNKKLYVFTRFDNAISVVDTNAKTEVQHLALFNPEPVSVTKGRSHLYDAAHTSSHGDSACASCHVSGDFDGLAWDLGDPLGSNAPNYNPIVPTSNPTNPFYPSFIQTPPTTAPMKGPMVTQSLRGLANHGPMHWRGDRTGAGPGIVNAQPDTGAYDENAAFNAFNVAFNALNGLNGQLPVSDMQDFTNFTLQVTYPPNPIRNLDNSLTTDQQIGSNHFNMPQTDNRCAPDLDPITHPCQFACVDCHSENPSGNAQFGVPIPGFFGTSGESFRITFDPVRSQAIKNPHFRNLYQKVGMFGMPQLFVEIGPGQLLPGTQGTGFMGDQIRGFGYIHDGSFDTVDEFLSNASFANFVTPNGFAFGPDGEPDRQKLAKYLLAFDSNLKPIVGQQVTYTSSNAALAGVRADLLLGRATAGDCELVAKIRIGVELGFLYNSSTGLWVSDLVNVPPITDAQLRLIATTFNRELTYTAVPLGSGRRVGVDADLDGYLDGDEMLHGTDPRDPNSHP